MAVNEVQLTISVGDNGSLGVVAKKADAAAKATGRLSKQTGQLGRASTTTYREMQGTAGTSSNLTKNFAKQAQGIQGGLVPAYATLAANVFAITAAFGALQRAAQVEQLVEGFTFLGNIAGRTATVVAESLVKITDNALSMEQALRAASAGMSAGFSTTELEGLTQVAKNAAQALGRDVGDATDRLIRGVGKLEPEILDELGIFVRLEPAVQKFATALGKNANALTETERRQAFLNAALEQGEKKFGSLTGQVDVNPYDKLAASFANLTKIFFNFINTGLGPIVEFFANNMTALTGAAIMFGSTVVRSMLPVLDQLGIKAADNAEEVFNAAEKIRESAKESVSVTAQGLGKFDTKLPKKNIYAQLKPSIMANTASNKELDDSIKAVTRTISGKEAALQKSSTKNISKIKAETAALKEELAVLIQLKAARSGQGTAFQEADIAETKAIAQGLAADKAEAVQNSNGIREAFATANKGFKEYKKDIGGAFRSQKGLASNKFAKGLVSVKFAFEKAAVGARLFGIALVNSIPLIGQIITIGGILLGFLTDFFGKTSKASEAQKQLNTILDTAGEKIEQYEKEVARLNDIATAQDKAAISGEIYANTVRLQAGFTDEFTSGLDKLINAVNEADTERGLLSSLARFAKEKVLQKLGQGADFMRKLWEKLKDELNALGDAFMSNRLVKFLGLDKALTSISESVDNTTQSFADQANELELTRKVTAAYDRAMEEGGVMADRLREKFTDGDGLIAAVKKAEKGGLDFKQALEQIMAGLRQTAVEVGTESKEIDSLGSSFAELQQSLSKFREAEAGKDKFATLASEVETRVKLLKSIQEKAEPGQFANLVAKEIEDGTMSLEEFGITEEQITTNAIGNLQELADHFTEISDRQRTIKEEQKKIKLDTAFEKATVAVAKANRELKNMEEILNRFGKTSFAGLDFFNDILATQKETNAAIEKEFANRRKIARLQHELEILEIAALIRINVKNEERVRGLARELSIKAELYGLTLKTIDAEEEVARIRNNIDFVKRQEQQRDALVGAIKGAETLAEKIRILNAAADADGGSFKNLFKIFGPDGVTQIGTSAKAIGEVIKSGIAPAIEEFNKLGPEGEAVATSLQGIQKIVDAFLNLEIIFANVAANIGDRVRSAGTGLEALAEASKLTVEEKSQVALGITQAVAASMSAIFQTMAAGTRNRIAHVDAEIEAEKKRDGKSKESLARLAALEKKKEALRKKEFDQKKKGMMAEVVMNTALGLSAALTVFGKNPILGGILMGIVAAVGAAQLAIISGMSYAGGGSAGAGTGAAPSKISAGERGTTVDLASSQSSRGEIAFMRGERGMGQAENFRPGAFAGYKNRAEGGNTGFIVGEQGPELFVPQVPGTIVPNDDMAAAGGTANVTFNINAVDAAGVEDVLLQQRGNLIGMIREASNSYGQTFLEDVDTSVYSPQGAGVSRY